MPLLSRLTNLGVDPGQDYHLRRSVILTNTVALVFLTAVCALTIARWIFFDKQPDLPVEITLVLFALPLLLNRVKMPTLSGIWLAWSPVISIYLNFIVAFRSGASSGAITYDAMKIFLLGFAAIPFLTLNFRERKLFIVGCIVPTLGTVLCDPIMDAFDIGPLSFGASERDIRFNTLRALISYCAVAGSCFSLRYIVDKTDRLNEKLIGEIREKNIRDKERAEREMNRLNTALSENIQTLDYTEKKYQALFEQASDAIMITDLQGNLEDMNQGMCRLLKYSISELRGKNIADVFDPDELRTNPVRYSDLIAGKQVVQERLVVDSAGRRISIEASVQRLDGNHLVAIWRDITDRKQTAKKLLKSIQELNVLNTVILKSSEATTVEQYLKDICHVLTNAGAPYKLAWIGTSTVGVAGQNMILPSIAFGDAQDYTYGLAIDLDGETLEQGPAAVAMRFGSTHVVNVNSPRGEYLIWHKRASTFGLNAAISICVNALPIRKFVLNVYSGDPAAFDEGEVSVLERIASHIAVTIRGLKATQERDEAKEQLVAAYERLNYHISHTPLAVIEHDADLAVTFWNKRAEQLFGWPASVALGRNINELIFPDESKEDLAAIVSKAAADGTTAVFIEREASTKSGIKLSTHWYFSFLREQGGRIKTILSFVSDVTPQEKANYLLNERIKELTTLYRAGQILSNDADDIKMVFERLVDILPWGWQYPEVSAARIVIGDLAVQTKNFRASAFPLRASFAADDNSFGFVEVVYLEEKPAEDEGPFFAEERNLLNTIAGMIQAYIFRKNEEAELNQSQANLYATINNSQVMIWSVDRNCALLTYNEVFRLYNRERLGLTIKPGMNHHEFMSPAMAAIWDERYTRSLAGEKFVFEENVRGIDFRFSLSPIIEGQRILGVSVFADDVTERNAQHAELTAANKRVNEYKMMALRSVMNPHFVFNVLSSIQYFITRNDQLNAIHYLGSFSKLMRTVLTRSSEDLVSVKDELALLTEYVNLEKLRFEEKFDFAVEYDKDLELDNIRIPTLLIQPFVENAILHGLYNKDGRGQLTIRAKADADNYLVFEVEDDGIGREAAARLKTPEQRTRRSMGTQITEERLKLINADSQVAVSYTDLASNNRSCGTLVRIKIKLHNN